MNSYTEVVFSSKTDNWATPQWLFDQLNEEFHFTLDVCADSQNAKCGHYFTREQDGLSQKWEGRVWCNPPYGRTVGNWVKKAAEFVANGGGGGLRLCCSPPELIHDGFTPTYTGKRRFVLLKVAYDSVMQPKMLPSPV